MIRFGCLRCRAVLEVDDHKSGQKVACPRCQQRLQIPALPPPNKTILAPLIPAKGSSGAGSTAPVASFAAQSSSSPSPGRPADWLQKLRARKVLLFSIAGGVLFVVLLLLLLPGGKKGLFGQVEEPTTCRELAERVITLSKGRLAWCTTSYPTTIFLYDPSKCNNPSIWSEKQLLGVGDSMKMAILDEHNMPSVIVQQCSTATEAHEKAGAKKSAFSYGRFMISGSESLLNELRSYLR